VAVVHGRTHATWGGSTTASEEPFAPYLSSHFLQWQLMGEDASRRRLMDLVDVGVDPCAFDDTPMGDPQLWGGDLVLYYEGCTGASPPSACTDPDPDLELVGLGRPLVRADFGQGDGWVGSRRDPVDTLDRPSLTCETFELEGSELGLSSLGGEVSVIVDGSPGEGEGPCVCIGEVADLNDGVTGDIPDACSPSPASFFGNPSFNAHDGNMMLVHYGGELGPVTIEWSLAAADAEGTDGIDISGYTHVSVRVANVLTDPTAACDEVPDELTVNASLVDGGGNAYPIGLGVQVESDARPVPLQAGPAVCRSAQFAQTLRMPLATWCAEGAITLDDVIALRLEFPDDGQSHVALVDSIELVADPEGAAPWPAYAAQTCNVSDPPEPCPEAPPSGWNCIGSIALVATETSCSGEPTAGECDVGDIEQDVIPLPDLGAGVNWAVHVPRGWIRDPENPTQGELDAVLERCVDACELEWADDPFIEATCSAGAFLTPTLRSVSSQRPQVAIPDALADGDGLFTGESLGCDLRTTCSAAFDENLGPARTRRPSPAGEPLHRGEEWLITATGLMQASSSYAAQTGQAGIEAEIGYSRCATGNTTTCPFYLASMQLDLLEPLALDLECGGVPVAYELTELSVRLAQPAFGVAEHGTDWNAFPPGGLILEAEGVVDEIPFQSRLPIEEAVYVQAADGLLWFQGIHGFKLELELPCNGVLADVDVWWDLQDEELLAGPPTLGIGHLPSTVACPDELALTLAWATDPEQDYQSLRWVVDGVLLDDEWPTIPVTESHQITAMLRDSRGATGSATHTVACE
jgi:hypothetical protein